MEFIREFVIPVTKELIVGPISAENSVVNKEGKRFSKNSKELISWEAKKSLIDWSKITGVMNQRGIAINKISNVHIIPADIFGDLMRQFNFE